VSLFKKVPIQFITFKGRSKLAPRNSGASTAHLKSKVSMVVSDDPAENIEDMKSILINIFTEIENHLNAEDHHHRESGNELIF
jgi:hypothetical protein